MQVGTLSVGAHLKEDAHCNGESSVALKGGLAKTLGVGSSLLSKDKTGSKNACGNSKAWVYCTQIAS